MKKSVDLFRIFLLTLLLWLFFDKKENSSKGQDAEKMTLKGQKAKYTMTIVNYPTVFLRRPTPWLKINRTL